MSTTNEVVIQTTAVVASLLKPLIDQGACKVTRDDDQLRFVMRQGSAQIMVTVHAHPAIKDDALVEVLGSLAQVDPKKLDIQVFTTALVLNNELNGFAIALMPKSGLLCLRGTLIGSTMDETEFNYLLLSLSQSADDLDDKFAGALAGSNDTGAGGGDGLTETLERLKEMAGKIQNVISERVDTLVQAFAETLSNEERQQFAEITKDVANRETISNIAFGAPAAKLVTLLVTNDLNDKDRRDFGRAILEDVPKHELLLKMLAFTVMATAKMVADAVGVEMSVVQARLKMIFE